MSPVAYGKESACNTGDIGSIPGLGRFPREGKGYPLQYCGLENSMDCIVHGVTKSRIQLSDFHKLSSLLSLHALTDSLSNTVGFMVTSMQMTSKPLSLGHTSPLSTRKV